MSALQPIAEGFKGSLRLWIKIVSTLVLSVLGVVSAFIGTTDKNRPVEQRRHA